MSPHTVTNSKERRQDAPQHRIGNPNHEQSGPNDDAEQRIDAELRQEVLTKTAAAVVDGKRCPMEIPRTDQTDQAVPKILPLKKCKDGDHKDNAKGC